MMSSNQYVIIVAGGKGLRMGSDIPKQFLPIAGTPLLMHTIRTFRDFNPLMHIILALPRHQQDYWQELCRKYGFNEPVTVVDGGQTRFHSVKNALCAIPDNEEGVVGVHDGVRPFPSADTIERVFAEAEKSGAAVPVVPVIDALRHIAADGEKSETVARSEYRIVQTPQAFGIQLLKKAYRQEFCNFFTDDASVAESDGNRISLVEGNRENIKITTPFDLAVAESVIKKVEK